MSDTQRVLVKGNEFKTHDMVTIGGAQHFVTSTEPIGRDYTKLYVTHMDIDSKVMTDSNLTVSNNLHFSVIR
jgi:protein associated with RNAse G/E